MKRIISLAISILIPALVLSACGSGAPASSTGAGASNTAAAQTVFAAQTAAVLPASTALPSFTPVPLISPTLTPTAIPTSPVSNPVVPVSSPCDDALFVSDVTIPDGTVIVPGGGFTKTWSIQNTGTCDWSTAYALAFLSGSPMDGVTTKLSASVAAGDAVNISVGMYAPLTAGTYTGYWRMQDAVGTFFGEAIYVKIVVSGGTVTVSITPTITGTASSQTTATSISTATGPGITPTSTPTTVPVSTATPTPAPTDTPTAAATS